MSAVCEDCTREKGELFDVLGWKVCASCLCHPREQKVTDSPPYPQPAPVPNGNPSVVAGVIADLEERKAFGLKKYGTTLQVENGRDALVDAYKEALDGCCYLKQLIDEREARKRRVNAALIRVEQGYHEQGGATFPEVWDVLEKEGVV